MSTITKTYDYRHTVDLSLFETEQDKQRYIKWLVAEFVDELPFDRIQELFAIRIEKPEGETTKTTSVVRMSVETKPKKI